MEHIDATLFDDIRKHLMKGQPDKVPYITIFTEAKSFEITHKNTFGVVQEKAPEIGNYLVITDNENNSADVIFIDKIIAIRFGLKGE